MTFTFRPPVDNDDPIGLIIGLAGGTGSGKTYSAMRLAKGIAGDKRFAIIDTEGGRAKHYKRFFDFDHGDLKPDFRPSAYMEAIEAADDAGYPVIVVDSVSHEWSGEGGVLEWQEEEYKRLGSKESIKLLSWSAPKQAHKRMVSRLLQCRAHLILCFRAEPHVEMVKEDDRTVVRPKTGFTGYNGWFPVTEKNLPFELTVYFMMMAERPGIPLPIKLQEQHKALFPAGEAINEEAGRRIAEWARGGGKSSASTPTVQATAHSFGPSQEGAAGSDATDAASLVTTAQAEELHKMCVDQDVPTGKLVAAVGVETLKQMRSADFDRAKQWVNRYVDARIAAREART